MRVAVVMMWTWSTVALAGQSPEVKCPQDGKAEVIKAAAAVEQSFYSLDQSGFDIARNQLGKLMVCVDTSITVADAIALHRARALTAFVDDDIEASRRAFAAIHALQPDWSLNPDELPTAHPLWRVYESAVDDDEDPRQLPLATVPEHGWNVDGTEYPQEGDKFTAEGDPLEDYTLPADRALVLQVYGKSGAPTYTGYHVSPADIPIADLVLMPDRSAIAKTRRKRARVAGTVVATSLLAGAATTFGLGMAERKAFDNGEVPIKDVLDAQRRGNAYGVASASMAGAGVLTATLAWGVRW